MNAKDIRERWELARFIAVGALIILLVALALVLSSCAPGFVAPPVPEAKVVQQQQQNYQVNQPIPQFDFSLERDILIQLYRLRNEAASTYTVVVDSHGGVIYQCPSAGYPIPADTKLTSPDELVYDRGEYGGGNTVVEQPEPNGLYRSNNTVGTWVLCVMKDGAVYPYYTEMNAQTWLFPVKQVKNADTGEYMFVPMEGAKPVKTINIKGVQPPARDPAPEATATPVP